MLRVMLLRWFVTGSRNTRNFAVLLWPTKSTDLNLSKHLWEYLDEQVRRADSQAVNLKNSLFRCSIWECGIRDVVILWWDCVYKPHRMNSSFHSWFVNKSKCIAPSYPMQHHLTSLRISLFLTLTKPSLVWKRHPCKYLCQRRYWEGSTLSDISTTHNPQWRTDARRTDGAHWQTASLILINAWN